MPSNRHHSRKRVACVMLSALLAIDMAAGAAPAQEAPDTDAGALSMLAAVQKALRWHPSLRNARAQFLQAGEGIDAAHAGYYPQITGGVNTQASDYTIPGYDSDTVYRARLGVSQLLYDFGRTDSKVDRAKAVQGTAQAQVQQAAANVIRNTAEAWIQVRKYKALVDVATKRLDSIQALGALVHKREVKGASTHSDTTQAEARADAARLKRVTAEAQVRRWRTILMHWVGSRGLPEVTGKPWPSLGDACIISPDVHVAQAATVRIAEAQLMVARADADAAETQLRPTLSLNATVSRGLGSDSQRIGEDGVGTAITLDFSMPLYQGGRLRSNEQAAQYGVAASRAALEQARLEARDGLQTAVVQWRENAALQNIQVSRVNSMRVTRRLYRQQYLKLGTRSLLDLLNAEQEYYDVRGDQIRSRYEMYRLGIDCLYYTGQLHASFKPDSDSRSATHGIPVAEPMQ